MADVSKALNIVRKLSPTGFFSRATEEAQRLPQAKGTPEQMRSMLLKQGVKPDELKWTGFDDWAKGKKSVTRDEVADFLRRNEVQVDEQTLGDNVRAMQSRVDALENMRQNRRWTGAEEDEYRRLVGKLNDDNAQTTKFEQYTLPGGENYRELLLQDQINSARSNVIKQKYEPALNPLIAEREALRPEYMRLYKEGPDNEFYKIKDKFSDLNQEIGRIEGRMQAEIKDLPSYRSSHWDEPNILAHLRLKDRVDPEGRRILHVEEIQSDWGQAGRRQGFAPKPLSDAEKQEATELTGAVLGNRATEAQIARLSELDARGSAFRSNVPQGPFVDSTQKWTDLALKRALTEAAGGDYAGLAFTPGREQAKRYPGDEGRAAGMMGYYDQIVPKRLQELTRPLDPQAKMSTVDVPRGNVGASGDEIMNTLPETSAMNPEQRSEWWSRLDPQARDQLFSDYRSGGFNLPFLEITPTMREKIKEGLPLFTMVPAAVGLGASQMQEGQNPAVEGEGFADGGKIVRKALEAVRGLPPAANSRLTQIATTGPSYEKALRQLLEAGVEGRALDYGAGRGHGLRSIGADTFEPYPQGWTPTYTKPEEIPEETYRRLINLNVLNVLDPQAREAAVLNMGRVVEPGGGGVISTRGRDVMNARGEPGPEPMSLIIGQGDQARYQKGFTPRELREYVGDTLGSRFDVDPADVGQASVLFRRNREDGGMVEDQGFDKGGSVVKKAIELSRRVMGYSDPPSKKIDDWKWRPLPDVATELDVQKIPPHVQQFGDYMLEMADKAKRGEISDRDLIKAYTTTRASIQRRSQDTDKIREASGLPLVGAEDKIRPEGAWAEWLMSPAGQRYLDKAVKGEMPEDTVESALSLMRSFGLAPTQINAMDWAAKNLPGRGQAASDLVYRASQKASPASEWRDFTSDVAGVGSAKSGFLASLLGRGDLPTLDARQVILNTGLPTEASQKVMARSYQGQKGFGAQEGVDRLAARQEALGLEAPAKYDPFYQHLTHHTIWDKASNEKTTHADIINAMRNAAIVLGVPAAGAAVMPEEQPVERASGGRLLEDQYPTHYLPNVGRQVMQDGGVPDDFVSAQGRRRAALDELGAFEDRPPMDPATMGQNWASAVQRFREKPLREGETVARPLELGGRDVIGGAIAGDGGIIRSRIADIVAGSRGLPGSGTVGFGAADFTPAGIPLAVSDMSDALRNQDYTSAALTAALPAAYYARKPIMAAGRAVYDAGRRAVDVAGEVLGRVPAPVAAGAAGAVAMTPEEAEAAGKSKMVRQVLDIVRGITPPPSNKDPRFWHNISSTKLSRPLDEMSARYERVDPEFRAPIRQPSDYENKALITTFGDPSIGGVRLLGVNDETLTNPTLMQAGPGFVHGAAARGPDRSIWASDLPMVSALANRAAAAQKAGYEPFLNYVKMGGESPDYSHHITDPLIDLFRQSKVGKDVVAKFDEKMRTGFNKDFPPYPDWPGLRSRKLDSYLFETGPGKARTAMAKLMATGDFQKLGMPDVAAVRFAATDPDLLNVPNYSSGRMIGRMDPNAVAIREPAVPHKTYRTQLSAHPEGADPARFSADVPLEISHYDWVQRKLAEKPNMNPSQLQYTYTRSAPTLYMKPETVDRMSTFLDLKARGLIP